MKKINKINSNKMPHDVMSKIKPCLEGLLFLFYSIEKLGWSQMIHLILGQEMLRLDTLLRIIKPRLLMFEIQFVSIENRVQNYVQRLELQTVNSWPLLVLRGQWIIQMVCHIFQVQPKNSAKYYQEVCQLVLRRAVLGQASNRYFYETSNYCATKMISFADFAQGVWSNSKVGFAVKHFHNASVYAGFDEQVLQDLIPKAGVLSKDCWSILQFNVNRFNMVDLSEIIGLRIHGSILEQQALYQLLISKFFSSKKQPRSRAFFMVDEGSSWCVIFEFQEKLKQYFQDVEIDNSSSYVSDLMNYIQRYLPNVSIEFLSNISTNLSKLPEPVFSEKKFTQEDARKSVSLVVDQELQVIGYSLDVSWQLMLELMSRMQSCQQSMIFILDVNCESLQALLLRLQMNMQKAKTSLNNTNEVWLYFRLNEELMSSASLSLFGQLRQLGLQIGMYSEQSQDMFRLHFWHGTVRNLLLGPDWYTDIQSLRNTVRGNGIARMRHLSQQGWRLAGAQVRDYITLASLLKFGFQSMTIHADLKQDILNQAETHLS